MKLFVFTKMKVPSNSFQLIHSSEFPCFAVSKCEIWNRQQFEKCRVVFLLKYFRYWIDLKASKEVNNDFLKAKYCWVLHQFSAIKDAKK